MNEQSFVKEDVINHCKMVQNLSNENIYFLTSKIILP